MSSATAQKIPASSSGLFAGLERILDAELSRAARSAAGPGPLVSLDLLAANSNRGPALLRQDTLDLVRLSLDRFKDIGVGCVKFALSYPLLRPDFPRAAEYLAFYRKVVAEAHSRGLKVMPHITVLFADTPFSLFHGIYAGLDLARFKREYRDMVHLVVRELRPDFLALLTEPDTHARLTGLRELETPLTMAEVIRFALNGLDRGKTRIGAGSGSWSSPDFARALAETTRVDFICIHVYPIVGSMLDKAREMARLARANGKQAMVDEAWLYKTLKPGEGEGVAATSEVFRLDVFSFWQPLDRKFMEVMLRMASEEGIALVSFFWSNQLFAYLDYDPMLQGATYSVTSRRHNREVYAAMKSGSLSPLGEWLRKWLAR